jgi:hypothetical protein
VTIAEVVHEAAGDGAIARSDKGRLQVRLMDDDPPTRSGYTRHLINCRLRIIDVMEHPIDATSVEAGVWEVQATSIPHLVLD